AVRLSVEDEFGIFRAIRQIAQCAKRPFAERAADGIADQPFDADDDVGVDVAAHDRRSDSGELVEGLWHDQRSIVRTSAMAPAIAAAAALAGLARCVRARGPWRATQLRL